MSSELDLFPLGIATGSAHCNRAKERADLTRNVLAGAHTWLWGRRRMGKTSLVEQVLQDLAQGRRHVAAATIDLLVVHDVQDFEARVRTAVERLSARIVPKNRRSSGKLAEAFAALKPEFSFGALGLAVKLPAPPQVLPGIAEMLLALDRAAGMYRRRAVIVFDEFQQIAHLKAGTARHGPEGAVRHAAERARNVTYLFAGSRRHLLASMFEDEERPLYRLCRKMTLDRIAAADYRTFLRQAGEARWRSPTQDAAIDRILAATGPSPLLRQCPLRPAVERRTAAFGRGGGRRVDPDRGGGQAYLDRSARPPRTEPARPVEGDRASPGRRRTPGLARIPLSPPAAHVHRKPGQGGPGTGRPDPAGRRRPLGAGGSGDGFLSPKPPVADARTTAG